MENLSFGFTLDDKMSSALKSITESLAGVINYLEDVNKSIEGVDKQNFNTLKKNITQTCSSIDSIGKEFSQAATSASGSIQNVASSVDKTSKSLGNIGAETSKSIQSASKDFNSLNSNLTQISGEASSAANELRGINTVSVSGLDNEIDSLNSSLNQINGNSLLELGNDANKAGSELNSLKADIESVGNVSLSGIKGETGKVESALKDISSEAKKTKSQLEQISEANVQPDGLASISEQLSGLGDAINLSNFMNLSELASSAADAITGIGASALEAGENYTNALNSIKMGLDVTEEEAQNLQNIARNVFTSGFGESVNEVTDQLVYMKQVFGEALPDDQIQALLPAFISLDNAGMDFNETLRGVKNLTTSFGVDAQTATGYMVEGMKRGLNFSEELGDNIAEYAARWGEAGVPLGNYFSLLEAGTKNGAYQLDKVGDFLNEFMTSLSDGRMDEAMASLSAGTQGVFDAYKANQATAQDVLNAVIGDMQKMTSETERAALASTLWSSLGEDNAMGMMMALGGVTDTFGDVSQKSQQLAEENSNAVTELKNKWEDFKNSTIAPLGNAIANVALTIINGFAPVAALFSNGLDVSATVNSFTSLNTAIDNASGSFSSMVSNFVSGIQQNLPNVATQAGQVGSTFITGIMNTNANLIGTGAQMVLNLIVGLAQAMPSIVTAGFNFLTSFLSGLMSGMPQVLDTALNIIESFIGSLAENLPTLIQSGAQTLLSWVQGFQQALPTLFTQAVVMISGVVQTIGQHLPEMITKGFELISNLVTGILQALPTLAQTAMSLIGGFGVYIIQNLPTIIQAGVNLVGGLISGLINSIPALLMGVAQLLSAIMDGIAQAVPGVLTAAWDMGTQLIQGLTNGISSAWSGFVEWLGTLWNEMLTNVKSFFGIASPSTVFNDIGMNLLQGLWDGLKSVWEGLSGWIGGIWDSIKNAFSGGSEAGGIDFSQANQQLDEFKAKVEIVFNDVSQRSLILGQALTNNIVAGLGSLPGQMALAFAAVQGAMQAQVAQIVAMAISGFQALIPAISAVFNSVASQCVGLLNTFSASVQSVIASMAQVLANSFSAIAVSTIAQFEIIKNQSLSTMQSMISSIETQFSNFANSLLNTFSTLSNNLSLKLGTLVSTFNTGWSNIKNDAINIISQMCNQILNMISKLVQDITNTMGRLKNEFSQIAKDMMSQFIAGINSQSGAVVNAAGELVSKLKETFESGLGIHSPSDYMIWIGQMMLAGLMKGMSSSQIQSFIESTINDMQSSFEAGNFNAAETMDFISQQGALDLIAKVTGMDLSAVENAAPTSIPAIIQEALKYENYQGSGGLNGSSMFGLHYGNPGAWCVSFVRYCAEQVGVPFPATNYVPDVTAWAQANGRWTMTPQPGYAAIFSNRHIELVTDVYPDGRINYIGGNTGHGEVKHRPRSDATGFVALDGGHAVGNTLAAILQQAYNAKYNPTPTGAMTIGEGSVNWNPSAGASQWSGMVLQVLQMLGQPASELNNILYIIDKESSGDPNPPDYVDYNYIHGYPSKGLMQTIPQTFQAYRNPSLSNNILDPMANIYAGINYMIHRYGSISNTIAQRRGANGKWNGYAVGTRYVPYDMMAPIHKGEAILPANQNPYTNSGGDYLGDMFANYVQPNYEFEPYLNADDYSGTPAYTGTSNNVNITLQVNQNINDGTDAKKVAEETVNYLYDELERQFNGTGGGVMLEY